MVQHHLGTFLATAEDEDAMGWGVPQVAGGVLHVFLRAIRSTLRATSPGAPGAVRDIQIGAVSFLHRFGSSLNAHLHYHVVVLDGVFSEADEGGVRFHEASELQPHHWQELQRTVQRRVLRYFRRHNLLDESTTADMLAWQGTGGFSLDASVRIEGVHFLHPRTQKTPDLGVQSTLPRRSTHHPASNAVLDRS